jgi:hypothetical protein
MCKAPFKNNSSAKLTTNSGQSLIEILIGLAVGVIIIGGVAGTIAVTLRSNVQNKNIQTATSLAQELVNKLTDFASANWHNIDALGLGQQYYLIQSGAAFSVQPGIEPPQTIDNIPFSRYFTVENVSRDANDNIEAVYNSANDDPSTKKAVVTVSWQQGASPAQVTLNKFLTRRKNLVFDQTDWSGTSGQTGPNAELLALNRTSNGVLLHFATTVAVVLILIDMIWKPGA